MKSSINIILFLISISASAQIYFGGKGSAVDSLNTHYGQNYLSLDPYSDRISFTQDRSGISDSFIERQQIGEQAVILFTDWLDTPGMVSPIGFSDGYIYFNKVVLNRGIYKGEVFRTTAINKKPQRVEIPFLKNKSPIQSGCISSDGKYMILSMESNNTHGVEDLYIVKKKADGTWDRAKNLGLQLNTKFQEVTPFLAEDNKTLFFATNGRGGEGSFDLFYTIRQDNSWRNWSEPVNLGPQINTAGAETSFTYRDGSDWAYYISSRDSDGYGDVMKIKFEEEIAKDTLVTEIQEQKTEAIALEKVFLKAVDAKTGIAIPTEMITEEKVLIGANGVFIIDSLSNEEVELKSPGYLPKVVRLDSLLVPGENLIQLSSVKKGSVITLDHVLFKRGSSDMLGESSKELDLVVEVMNDNPNIKILLKGHTDNTGDPVKNIQLSEARVRTVKEYIINQGISAYRVSGRGYGGNQPIASNASEDTRMLNRRVEFEVVAD